MLSSRGRVAPRHKQTIKHSLRRTSVMKNSSNFTTSLFLCLLFPSPLHELSVNEHNFRSKQAKTNKQTLLAGKKTCVPADEAVKVTFEPGKFRADDLLLRTETKIRPDFLKALKRAQTAKVARRRLHYVKMSVSLTASLSLTFCPR